MTERDPMTFETRLTEAFAQYVAAAPVEVDARTMSALVADGAARPRIRIGPGRYRLALVLGLLALATIGAALLAGAFLRSTPEPLGDGGRILAWLPTGPGAGTAYLVGTDGTIRATRDAESRSCPVLLGSADAIATGGFGSLFIRSLTGAGTGQLSTDYAGFERWSDDRRAIALVDMENGPATVATFPGGDTENPAETIYPITGSLEGAFSPDGARFALLAPAGDDQIAVHVLAGGTDTVVTELTAARAPTSITWAPDGGHVVLATVEADGPHLVLISVDDGSQLDLGRPDGQPAPFLMPIAWSSGMSVLVMTGPDSVAVLDTLRARWEAVDFPFADTGVNAEWRTDPSHLAVAIINGASVVVRRWDGEDVPIRQRELRGTFPVFSPDGNSILTVVQGASGGETGPLATLWATDVWVDGASRAIAELPQTEGLSLDDQQLQPCLQWLPEVQP